MGRSPLPHRWAVDCSLRFRRIWRHHVLADPLAQREGSGRLSARGPYLLGLLIVGLLGAVAAVIAPPSSRGEVGAGVLLALLVQAPLGWWTLRSIGTETFQLVWVGGMILRLAVVGVAAVGFARVYH